MSLGLRDQLALVALSSFLPQGCAEGRPISIALTSSETAESAKSAGGLTYTQFRRGVARLSAEGIVAVEPGSGRGRLSTIRFRQPPGAMLASWGESGPDWARDLMRAEAKRLAEPDVRPGTAQSVKMWPLAGGSAVLPERPNELLYASAVFRAWLDDPLIGRQALGPKLEAAVWRDPVVALVGDPGIGKTHFLAHWVGKVLDSSDAGIGVIWTSVEETGSADELLSLIRKATQTEERSSSDSLLLDRDSTGTPPYALLSLLKRRPLLVVLDDFERLLTPEGAVQEEGFNQFLALLMSHHGLPSRVILANRWLPMDELGRQPKGVEVPPLTRAETAEYVKQLLGYEPAAELVDQAFEASEGNPLSLQLIRADIEDGTVGNLSDRAASVESELFRSVTSTGRCVLATVAVLSGHATRNEVCTIAARHAEIAEEAVEATLDGLVRSRFLLREGQSQSGVREYRMHGLARRCCLELAVTEDERGALHGTAAEVFEQIARLGDASSTEWLYAIDHALAAGMYEVVGRILLGEGVGQSMLEQGRLQRLSGALESLLWTTPWRRDPKARELGLIAEERETTRWLLDAIRLLARIDWRLGKLHRSEALGKIAMELSESCPQDLALVAGIMLDRGCQADGLALARSIFDANCQLDRRTEMEAWGWIGRGLAETGPWEDSIAAYEKVAAIAGELGDVASESVTESRMGMVYWMIGRQDDALVHFQRGADLARQVGDPYYLGLSVGDLGHPYMDRPNRSAEDLDLAEKYYKEALVIHRRAGVRRGEGFWMGQLGRVALAKSHTRVAHRCLIEAIKIHMEVGDATALGRHLHYMAQVALHKGVLSLAIAYLQAAEAMLRSASATIEADLVHRELAEVTGRTESAILTSIVPPMVDRIRLFCATGAGSLPW